jgi:hypothetical protein
VVTVVTAARVEKAVMVARVVLEVVTRAVATAAVVAQVALGSGSGCTPRARQTTGQSSSIA